MDTYLRSKLSGYVGIINLLWIIVSWATPFVSEWPKVSMAVLVAGNLLALAYKAGTDAPLPVPDIKPTPAKAAVKPAAKTKWAK